MARRHLVISAIEHLAVMVPAMFLREQGWDVTVVPVDGFGRISLEDLEKSLRTETALVSVMHANNEVGTVQPIREIARLTRERGIVLHTDAAQSAVHRRARRGCGCGPALASHRIGAHAWDARSPASTPGHRHP